MTCGSAAAWCSSAPSRHLPRHRGDSHPGTLVERETVAPRRS
ncbi:MAG: hypothetical protein ACLTSX_06095 [Collinsella sp.]